MFVLVCFSVGELREHSEWFVDVRDRADYNRIDKVDAKWNWGLSKLP